MLILRILENAISSRKKQTEKKATRACSKVYRKAKIRRPATKEDKCCFFMIAKPLADRVTRR